MEGGLWKVLSPAPQHSPLKKAVFWGSVILLNCLWFGEQGRLPENMKYIFGEWCRKLSGFKLTNTDQKKLLVQTATILHVQLSHNHAQLLPTQKWPQNGVEWGRLMCALLMRVGVRNRTLVQNGHCLYDNFKPKSSLKWILYTMYNVPQLKLNSRQQGINTFESPALSLASFCFFRPMN